MRPRAIKDLARLRDSDLHRELAEGIRRCVVNALRLWRQAKALDRRTMDQGREILTGFANEEAAKVLILVDAARCPRTPQSLLPRQLERFNQHLSKGIYAESSWWNPATFEEVTQGIDRLRASHFLDGPSDVDWIIRNQITDSREGHIYVDYVEEESHYWVGPSDRLGPYRLEHRYPECLEIATALHKTGLTSEEALPHVSRLWRSVQLEATTHWQEIRARNVEMLEVLESQGVLRKQPEAVYRTIIERWSFPLWSLELSERRVNLNELREIQNSWTPDGYGY